MCLSPQLPLRNIEPYLYEGRKFHLRALLLCSGDLSAYIYENVRVLLATTKYSQGQQDSGRLDVHVTNMGVNQEVAGYSDTRTCEGKLLCFCFFVGYGCRHVSSICVVHCSGKITLKI